MNLEDIAKNLQLKVLTDHRSLSDLHPTTGYASDMLSCVMSGAKHQSIWVTLQAHLNIVAVATLLDLSAIIITEGNVPEAAVIEKAVKEDVILLSTPLSSFSVVGKLWELGIRE
jgi:hypothetical protein